MTQPDDLREETERHVGRVVAWANNWNPAQDRQTRERELLVAATHLRTLQTRNEQLAERNRQLETEVANRDTIIELERGIAKGFAERVEAIQGALEWAAHHVHWVRLLPNAVRTELRATDTESESIATDGTGASIADALIELAKRSPEPAEKCPRCHGTENHRMSCVSRDVELAKREGGA